MLNLILIFTCNYVVHNIGGFHHHKMCCRVGGLLWITFIVESSSEHMYSTYTNFKYAIHLKKMYNVQVTYIRHQTIYKAKNSTRTMKNKLVYKNS